MICGAFKRHNIARVAFPNAELIVEYVINVMTTAAILTAPDFAISWLHSSSWRTRGMTLGTPDRSVPPATVGPSWAFSRASLWQST
jgi:hypothetical protein